ncbi:hypothetical protein Q2K19_08605 [Micromonospora soli]|uniref:hypothetical protein n=1 Tax=Micromonospora sp. NBRC 110009 TaxID=3061627 RepID=UPI0026737213|nr:hypothetical protein [Micromonospora sp. NBRC 110009]WKU00525.1 hypothetical protein Q2K19_08605 [Micromonospora sp. NBRC 110009]
MAKQDRSRQQELTEQKRREEELRRSQEWADHAALARTADDPQATAPRDAGGRPSNGRQF